VLFDLQSPRRRRVIRVTFGALAAIFAISFVFLGVGTGGGGFSFSDLFGSGGGGSTSSAFDDDIKAAQEKLAVNPNDAAAHSQLVTLHYQKANAEADDQGRPTSDSIQDLQQSTDAWTKYLELTGAKASTGAAAIAYQAYFVLAQADFSSTASATTGSDQLQGLTSTVADLKGAAEAQKVVAQAQPSVGNWAKVAQAYALAGDTQGTQQAIAEVKKLNPAQGAKLEKQLKNTQQQGSRFQQAIKQLTKQQQTSQSAGGGNPLSGGSNPLNGLGTGGSLGGTP
jgi:tetratricopeptide (TPR) repeat protein